MFAVAGLLAAAAFVFYVLFGYPLLLSFLARRFARPVVKRPFQPSVSIIVAIHNGEAFLDRKLASILSLEYPRNLMEILLVSDGSTDRTVEIAERFSERARAARPSASEPSEAAPGSAVRPDRARVQDSARAARGPENTAGTYMKEVRVLSLPRNGKPAALNAGIAAASGEILVLTDVRQRLAPDCLRMLFENFADPSVGAASAELVILHGKTGEEASVGLYWKYEFRIRLCLSAIDSIFGATGACYAIRRELAVAIPRDSLLDDMYLPLAAFFRGYRLIVEPKARMFDYPAGLHSEFRRKVRTLAGNYQIVAAYPALLSFRNRMLFHYVSYKLARLFLPFAMLIIMVASVGVPDPWRLPLVIAQLAFYGTALADRWIPDAFPLKAATGACRTFVTLMAAAFCAVSVFFVPPDKLWRTPPPSGKD